MDQLILQSTGSFIQGAEVGALFADGLPDITNETTPIEDVDVEWISSLSDEDKSTFEWVISEYEIELTKEQKSALGN
jgi:hypothetical protein